MSYYNINHSSGQKQTWSTRQIVGFSPHPKVSTSNKRKTKHPNISTDKVNLLVVAILNSI